MSAITRACGRASASRRVASIAVDARHPQVHQDHVGRTGDRQPHRLLAVGRRADDLDARQQAEQHREALADDPLVVGEQHADRIAGRHAGR